MMRNLRLVMLLSALLHLSAVASPHRQGRSPLGKQTVSWYSYPLHPNRITANGERLRDSLFTCAMRSRKYLNHIVRLTLLDSSNAHPRVVYLWCNDCIGRGAPQSTVIDVSKGTAAFLHIIRAGRVTVHDVKVFDNPKTAMIELRCLSESADSIVRTRALFNLHHLPNHEP